MWLYGFKNDLCKIPSNVQTNSDEEGLDLGPQPVWKIRHSIVVYNNIQRPIKGMSKAWAWPITTKLLFTEKKCLANLLPVRKKGNNLNFFYKHFCQNQMSHLFDNFLLAKWPFLSSEIYNEIRHYFSTNFNISRRFCGRCLWT